MFIKHIYGFFIRVCTLNEANFANGENLRERTNGEQRKVNGELRRCCRLVLRDTGCFPLIGSHSM